MTKIISVNIKIVKKGTDDFKRLSEIKWQLFSGRNNKIILLYCILGIIMITLSVVVKKPGESFWGWETTIGCGLLIISLFIFNQQRKGKKLFFAQLNTLVNNSNHEEGEFVLEIDNTSLRSSGPTFSNIDNWSSITGFREFENYLFLLKDKCNIDTIGINIDAITKQEYTELISFLKEKFENNSNPY